MSEIPVLTLKLLLVSWITSKRQIIHERTASRTTWDQTYDFIIVGAGTAGSVVAKRLTEDPKVNVLLIEAGGSQNAIYNDIPGMLWELQSNASHHLDLEWLHYNQPQENAGGVYLDRRIPEITGRTIGGSSSHNTVIYNRGNQNDFDNWLHKYGANGWSYREVLPFFKKFENNTDWKIIRENPEYHGSSGPIQISTPKEPDQILLLNKRVYNDLGFMDTDVNGKNQQGVMIMQSYIGQSGLRSGAGNSYIDPNPHPNNLHILTKALVTKILFNNRSAIGVEFSRNDNPYKVYVRKEVILSAGPYKSAQLLMLSGIGPINHLKRFGIPVLIDLPVGNNFMNHPGVIINCMVDQKMINKAPELTVDQLTRLYVNSSGPLSQIPFLALYFSTNKNLDKEWPNILLSSITRKEAYIFYVNLVRIKSRGTVRLQTTSPYISPEIEPNFLYDSRDFQDLFEALTFLFSIIEGTSLSQYVTPPKFQTYGCPSCEDRYMSVVWAPWKGMM